MHRLTAALPASHHDATEAQGVIQLVQNLTRAVPGAEGPFDVRAAFAEIKALVRAP